MRTIYSFRLEKENIDRLRNLADREGKNPTALAREVIIQYLDRLDQLQPNTEKTPAA